MTRNFFFACVLSGAVCLFFSCGGGAPKPAADATPLTYTMQDYQFKKCLRDSVCAEIKLQYPVFSGPAETVGRLNDSIQVALYMAANADRGLPLKTALDSAGAQLFAMLKSDDADRGGEIDMSYNAELTGKVLMQTNRLVSLQMDGYMFTGGAHGYYYTVFNTFDIASAESLRLTDVVSDTAALRPLLERAFVDLYKKEMPEITLKDILLDPEQPLPLPLNFCILPSGVRFMYNPYEVAAYAFGQADIELSWEQLGPLADKQKWTL